MTSRVPTGPLLRVKRAIPPPRPGAVAREGLERRLDASTAKLAVVVAPAGWGKTSLLERWASRASTTTPVAWVSLDADDDEPVRFWTYVLTALHEADEQLGPEALEALVASGAAPTHLALPLLINELAGASTRHVVVLDDYQAITDRTIHESLEFFLGYLPPTAQVVIASRWDPPLPLARMRARGELVEVRADDLRFSPGEAAAMVSTVAEVRLDPTAVEELWRPDGGLGGRAAAGRPRAAGSTGPRRRGRPGPRGRPAPVRLLHQRGAARAGRGAARPAGPDRAAGAAVGLALRRGAGGRAARRRSSPSSSVRTCS